VCAISLALLKNGEPVYGFVYEFGGDRLIEGGEGQELLVNQRRFVPVEREFTVREGVVGLHFPLTPEVFEKTAPLLQRYRVRSIGSGTLILVYAAMGLFDGVLDFKVKIWDVAAACALLRASGRRIHFLGTSPFPLQEFHVDAPTLPYYAGSEAFCQYMEELGMRPL
jgi:myo-inositol-1(or 4)-monophosphatase